MATIHVDEPDTSEREFAQQLDLMFARLLVLFVVVPLVEVYLLYRVTLWTSFPTTVGLVLLTGVIGAWLAKQQGISTLTKIQQSINEGRLPGEALMDAAMILVAGALLLTPGILTDVFGFSLLAPPCRALYRKYLRQIPWNFKVQTFHHTEGSTVSDDGMVQGSAEPVIDDRLPE